MFCVAKIGRRQFAIVISASLEMARISTSIIIAYFFILVSLLEICEILGQSMIKAEDGEWIDFQHDLCFREIHNSYSFKKFHSANLFYDSDDNFELLVRFKGVADGHILLTENASTTEPVYMIIMGSYNNQVSEIRRTKQAKFEVKLTTPGVLSAQQWRGFIIRYQPKDGKLMVYPEGSDHALLTFTDPNPLAINFFSFSSYIGRVLEVAYDCRAKDNFSTIPNIRDLGRGRVSITLDDSILILLFCFLTT